MARGCEQQQEFGPYSTEEEAFKAQAATVPPEGGGKSGPYQYKSSEKGDKKISGWYFKVWMPKAPPAVPHDLLKELLELLRKLLSKQ